MLNHGDTEARSKLLYDLTEQVIGAVRLKPLGIGAIATARAGPSTAFAPLHFGRDDKSI